MSNDSDGMSDDELNSLISDLEGRANQGGGGDVDVDAEVEDMDAFLADLEEGEGGGGGGTSTKTASKEQAGPDLSDLGAADELPATTDGDEQSAAKKKAQAEDESVQKANKAKKKAKKKDAEGGGGAGWKRAVAIAWTGAKWAGYVVPVVALWWLVGAYLGQWVSAGWLIFLVAGAFSLGVPFGAYRAAKNRGKFRWWLSGAGVVLTLLLSAPMAGTAGKVMSQYGHWPATTVDSIVGWENSGLVKVNAATSEWIGSLLNPALSDQETRLPLGATGAGEAPPATPPRE